MAKRTIEVPEGIHINETELIFEKELLKNEEIEIQDRIEELTHKINYEKYIDSFVDDEIAGFIEIDGSMKAVQKKVRIANPDFHKWQSEKTLAESKLAMSKMARCEKCGKLSLRKEGKQKGCTIYVCANCKHCETFSSSGERKVTYE